MSFFQEFGTAVLLVIATLWLQCAGIAALIVWVRKALAGDIHRLGPFRSAMLVVRLTAAIIDLHGLLILFWASCYRWLCFPSWESAFYFSASSYATVGYGDVVLPAHCDVGAAGEHYGRVDVWNIGQRSVCGSYPARQPRSLALVSLAIRVRYTAELHLGEFG